MADVKHHDIHVESLTRSTPGHDVRLDIEGLRAIAIGTVLAFHAGLPWVSGGFVGVDVFFVLSGFLITGLLVREVNQSGRVRLGRFWARRARRLLPASALVLAFSVLVTWVWLPLTQRQPFGMDIVSSALYVVNWRLAARSVDYQAEDIVASPVQHYWSLAIEEQFYVVWPLLILAVAVVFARRRVRGAFLALSTVTVVSFAYSVHQSEASPDTAFFVSTTRIWELGVGALLALAATRVARAPVVIRAAAGWVGLAAIAWAALRFDGTTSWPGIPALLPVLGAAGVIASGIGSTAGAPGRLLETRPMVWIGGISYSLYLWHWPILVAGQAAIGDFRLRHGIALTLVAFVPAWLSRRYVEDPIRFGPRFRPTSRALGLGAALTAAGVVIGLGLSASSALTNDVKEASPQEAPGARALEDPSSADVVWSDAERVDRMTPLPADAPDDIPAYVGRRPDCQIGFEDVEPSVCAYGDTTSDRVVVLVGSSKIAQWQGAFEAIAKREGWKLVQIFRSGCEFSDATFLRKNEPWAACRAWGRAALQEILSIDPDLVITTTQKTMALTDGGSEMTDLSRRAMVDGLARHWSAITDAGIPMAVLLDNPEPPDAIKPVYECVAQHLDDLRRCSFDRQEAIAMSGTPTQLAAAAKVPAVEIIDMADTLCPDSARCAPVIGNVLVYRQGTHITNTYVLSAQKQLAAALSDVSDGRFGSG
jgi:peptidoglycan/LPS O-acetylase OafA/YrhL